MFYTYILLVNNGNFYSGYSHDLIKRLKEHREGKVFATKNMLPIKLIYYEASLNKYDALKREKYFKSGPGKKYLSLRMKNYLSSIK